MVKEHSNTKMGRSSLAISRKESCYKVNLLYQRKIVTMASLLITFRTARASLSLPTDQFMMANGKMANKRAMVSRSSEMASSMREISSRVTNKAMENLRL